MYQGVAAKRASAMQNCFLAIESCSRGEGAYCGAYCCTRQRVDFELRDGNTVGVAHDIGPCLCLRRKCSPQQYDTLHGLYVTAGVTCEHGSHKDHPKGNLHTTQLSRELRGIARVEGAEDDKGAAPLVVFTDRRKFAVHLMDISAEQITTLAVAANYQRDNISNHQQ